MCSILYFRGLILKGAVEYKGIYTIYWEDPWNVWENILSPFYSDARWKYREMNGQPTNDITRPWWFRVEMI